jgi:hypothetical protein
MTVQDTLNDARFQLDDEVAPYKWSDTELIRYYNRAREEACRRSYLYVSYPSAISITGNSNISFVITGSKIIKASGGLLSAGGLSEVNTFEKDDEITITGTTLNNGIKTIVSVTDTEIVTLESIVSEPNTSAIITATRTATRIPLRTGVHTYKLHPSTLMVIRAKPESLEYPLRQRTIWSLDAGILISDYDADYVNTWYCSSWETLTGNMFAFLEENGFIRIISPPIEDDILWMAVARLPKIIFTTSDLSKTCTEIPLQYHNDLVDWILHLAYMKQDGETQDLSKAAFWEKSFERKFGVRPSAQTEMNRRRYPPNMKMRPVEFGF